MPNMDSWLNKIILGDCLDVMKEMPENACTLLLTDPPYGVHIAESGKVGGDKPFGNTGGAVIKSFDYKPQKWDMVRPSKAYFQEMYRVCKNQIIFGGNYFIEYLYPSACWIVWDKDNSGNFADCELAWTSFPTAVRKFKYRWNGMLQENMREKEKRIHPTQKPVALFEWILNHYSEPGDIILDPFSGSGTVAAACINLNRNYIAIEIDPGYVQASEQRIARATQQLRMF